VKATVSRMLPKGSAMQWKVHRRQPLYTSEWVNLELADVELPDGRHLAHHILRMPRQSAVAAVVDQDRRVLMLWRHRFITDRWGWELPAGWIDEGEDPATAAAREVLEETGWRPGPLGLLCSYSSDHGISDSRFYLFRADGAVYQGPPRDQAEATRVEWVPLSSVHSLIAQRQLDDGASLAALLFVLAFDTPSSPSEGR
jgi:8-oxo-dGTP pyrophosphatase MutT (NUDIX family)